MTDTERRRIAEAVRASCERHAREAYAAASISGLCAEGAWEAALGALQMLDLDAVLAAPTTREPSAR